MKVYQEKDNCVVVLEDGGESRQIPAVPGVIYGVAKAILGDFRHLPEVSFSLAAKFHWAFVAARGDGAQVCETDILLWIDREARNRRSIAGQGARNEDRPVGFVPAS